MRLLIPLALALASAAAAPVKADDDHDSALRLRERREILPLEEIMRRLDLGQDVRILEIESEMEHGAALYEIEYVERGGRIRKIRVDARSGQLLGDED
jgi:uncharacterized membrane protein YkoI